MLVNVVVYLSWLRSITYGRREYIIQLIVRIMNAGVFICNSRQVNVVDAQHT